VCHIFLYLESTYQQNHTQH